MLPDFPIFSKRIIAHPTWWDTIQRDDVALVDDAISHVTADGIVTDDGVLHPCDVIVLATGFHFSRMHGDLDLHGTDGHTLVDDWRDEDPWGYLGVTVPHFPNYFHMAGPNSAPNFAGGANIIAECQANYIVECLDFLLAEGAHALAPTEAASKEFHERIEEQLANTIWSHPRSRSYYQNSRRPELHVVAVPDGRLLERDPRTATRRIRAVRPAEGARQWASMIRPPRHRLDAGSRHPRVGRVRRRPETSALAVVTTR